jgi:hypothetical protein
MPTTVNSTSEIEAAFTNEQTGGWNSGSMDHDY